MNGLFSDVEEEEEEEEEVVEGGEDHYGEDDGGTGVDPDAGKNEALKALRQLAAVNGPPETGLTGNNICIPTFIAWGGFGMVCEVLDKDTGEKHAMKVQKYGIR